MLTYSPYYHAWAMFRQVADDPDSWHDVLGWHLAQGYVHSTPEYFIMGRPVDRFGDLALIEDDAHQFDEVNAWLISCAVGKDAYQQFYSHDRLALPWIGWHRRGRLRWYDSAAIKAKLMRS